MPSTRESLRRLVYHRLLLGLSRQQVADAAGVGIATINRLETASGNPRVFSSVDRVAKVFGLVIDIVPDALARAPQPSRHSRKGAGK